MATTLLTACADEYVGPIDARADRAVADGDDGGATDDVVDDLVTPPADASDDVVSPMDVSVRPDVTGMDTIAPTDVARMDVVTPPVDVPARDVPIDMGVDVPPLPPVSTVITPGTPADAPMRFGGTVDATRTPMLVYPADNTIVPPNLQGFEVHFMPGTGNDLFEVSFVGAMNTINIYAGCTAVGGGCVLALDAASYNLVARAARPSGQVTLAVRGTSASAGGRFGRSATRILNVTDTDVRGGIYYWSALAGNIMRYDFGLPGARAELYMTGGGPFACLGCHSLSRDGRRIAVGRFIPGPSQMQSFDTPSRAAVGAIYGANFATYNPDNTRTLVSDGARLGLVDTATGGGAPGLAGGFVGSMPDWSPDGRSAVFARPATVPPFGGAPGHGAPAALQVMPWSGTAFGAATDLVPSMAGVNNYYPAYAPDGAWVLFNRSTGDSYNNITAHLWAVRSSGGAPIALRAADDTGDLGNSWPKWAPFVQSYRGEPLMWLTFSSRRDYGLRLQQQSRAADMRRSQLWMAAFRPNRAASGDPTSPAFWMPMQNLGEGNHIAQWAQEVRRQTCVLDRDCAAGEHCVSLAATGVCVGN